MAMRSQNHRMRETETETRGRRPGRKERRRYLSWMHARGKKGKKERKEGPGNIFSAPFLHFFFFFAGSISLCSVNLASRPLGQRKRGGERDREQGILLLSSLVKKKGEKRKTKQRRINHIAFFPPSPSFPVHLLACFPIQIPPPPCHGGLWGISMRFR